MMRALCLLWFCTTGLAAAAADRPMLARAHAHNDYEHARPLAEALERGFGSIEADVWLVEGALLVAHDRRDAKPARTLASLYLEPLRERVRRGGGRIYQGSPLVLLVDVKSEAAPAYAALHAELARHADMLTAYRAGRVEPGAVTVIVSGNRARREMEAQAERFAFIDGRALDLDENPPATLIPWISENWAKVFPQWRWQGEMPPGLRAELHAWVARAQAQGRKVRFWNTPDRPDVWRALHEAGVDFIGTDDLAGLQRFLATVSAR